jgi:hypothetical protein
MCMLQTSTLQQACQAVPALPFRVQSAVPAQHSVRQNRTCHNADLVLLWWPAAAAASRQAAAATAAAGSA